MRMEAKYLHLRTPVELGSRFGDWQVCWLGGWAKHRLYYPLLRIERLAVVVRIENDRTRGTGGADLAKDHRIRISRR